jgi:hypothetical protein
MRMNDVRPTCLVAALACVGALAVGAPAHADLGFSTAGVALTGADGTFSRQAGAHADFTTTIAFTQNSQPGNDGLPVSGPAEAARDVELALPPGLVGDPTAVPTCTYADLNNDSKPGSNCGPNTQVGKVHVDLLLGGDPWTFDVGLYNLEHDDDVPALFGFNFNGVIATIRARVRPGDFGISAGSVSLSQTFPLNGFVVSLWGVPADPVHDVDRQAPGDFTIGTPTPSTASRRPFMTNPTSCTDGPAPFTLSGDSWDHPGHVTSVALTQDVNGTPLTFEGCDRLPFKPSIRVQPLSHMADAPTGLDVDVNVPQSDAPDGVATAHVRRTVVTLPAGMSVSPSSAAGLGACAPAEIGLGTNDAPTCPDSSKIGTVKIDTPLLEDPVEGDVILAKQDDNPFRSLLALYLAVKGPGFYLKLPGRVDPDPVTGQLTASFDTTPQLPFSKLHVAFRGGSRASLATPPACGTYTSHAEITSWASAAAVALDTPMTIDQGCDAPAFAPSFAAGTTSPLARQHTPFSFTLTRADRTPYLARIDAVLPAGLLADIAGVPRCDDALAADGSCPAESDIGSTSVLSGPGADPLALNGRVSLTGPYKDAPFGLSIAVPTAGQAGPFDLGVVVVRAGIYVDRTDAHVTVKSDPLPTIISGFPLRLRQVNVTIDRAGFMFNPTSCAPTTVFGGFDAMTGTRSEQTVPFRLGGCGDLDLDQKLALRFTGKTATKDNTHPGITARLTSKGAGANLEQAEVKLPLSVALDPDNAQALCKPQQRAALACPKASIVGQARAVSVLPHALTGPVYFVEGTRRTASGRTVPTLPKLWIPLSADGVTIDVNADSQVDSLNRLVTTFRDIPDAPIKQFDLTIAGGRHGIIVVSGTPGTCERDKTIDSRFTGQNGKVVELAPKATVEGCRPQVTRSSSTSRAVTLRLANIGPGQVSLSGAAIKRTSRTIRAASEASITAPMTTRARSALRRHGRVTVAVRIRFRPKGGTPVTVTKRLTIRR